MFPIGLSVVVGALAIIGLALYDARQSAMHQAEQAASNLALGLERDVGRALKTFDLSIRAAREGMKVSGIADMAPEIRQSILFDGAVAAEGFGGVVITDRLGNMRYDSAGQTPRRFNIGNRDYFKAARDRQDGGLAISRPLPSMSGHDWTLGLARRFNDADGNFAGVVAGGLRLDHIRALFGALKLGPLDTISMFSMTGDLLVRQPSIAGDTGKDISGAKLFQDISKEASGILIANAPSDGVQRLYAYQRVGTMPLVIVVGLATTTIYGDWTDKSCIIAASLFILLLIGVALVRAFYAELARRARAEQAARLSEQQHAAAMAKLVRALYAELAERARAEQAAKLSEQHHAAALTKLDAVFRGSSDAMFLVSTDADGAFVYESVNPVWEVLSGVPASIAVGHGPVACLSPEVASTALAGWQDCARERRPVSYRYTLEQEDGRQDWEIIVAPVYAPSDADAGAPIRLVGVGRDITRRLALEAELHQVHRMEAVGQLAAGIAHDFNNMCQAVLASMQTLRDEPGLGETSLACVNIAESAAQRGATLTHQLLAFSRKQALDPVLLHPQAVMAEMGVQLARTLDPRIHIDCRAAEGTWAVRADGGQLNNCLYNLARNADDAMPEGGLLRLYAENQQDDSGRPAGLPQGDYVRFDIVDQGSGMTAEILSRAFEPFFTTKAIGEGAGLGLSMVEGFARQSGGDVRVESVVGEGTTVSVWLPRAAADAGRAMATPPQRSIDSGRGRVLLVDDEASVRQALSLMLKRAGLAVVAVEAAEVALDLLHDGEDYDLLVTDQSMPGMTGCELIAETAAKRPDMAAMLITGYDKVSGLDQLDRRVSVLRKPFDRSAFLGTVQTLIASKVDE